MFFHNISKIDAARIAELDIEKYIYSVEEIFKDVT